MDIRTIMFSYGLLFLTAPVLARDKVDVIVMENGDRITGEIKGLESGVIRISVDYVDGNLSIQWSKVARIESPQLFLVRTEDGSVYTGALATPESSGQVTVRIAESDDRKVLLKRSDVVRLGETSESVRQRLSGDISLGLVYSKGNNATQYDLGSSLEFRGERWGTEGMFSSNLSSNNGSNTATRNQLDLFAYHLMQRNNYFYAGFGDFLRSSVQGINIQTTLGGGVGRYLKNSNRVRFSVVGGLAWQSADYTASVAPAPAPHQRIFAGVIVTDLRVFFFKKTNLTARTMLSPAFSDLGRVHFTANAVYYLKLFGNVDWNVSFYGNWDTKPPNNFAESDYGYSSGLRYTFGYK
jgi:hypothetical protein